MLQLELDTFSLYLPLLAMLAVCGCALWTMNCLLLRRQGGGMSTLSRQLILMMLTVITLVLLALALPVGESTQGDLLGLLGLVFTGVFALSSISFVSNAMAGFMLRSVKSFRHGDFIRVGKHFGRVTVVRSSGTFYFL